MPEPHDPTLRVLFVIDTLGPGGAERSIAELLPYLRAAGVAGRVVCLESSPGDGSITTDLTAQGFDVATLRARHLAGRAREVRALVAAERIDIVHTTLYRSNLVGRLAARSSPAAVITSFVNTTYDRVRLTDPGVSRAGLRLARAVESTTTRRYTDRVHAITNAVADSVTRELRVPRDEIAVIERGRSPERLGPPGAERRAAARKALGWDGGAPVLLHVGRQDYQKGHLDLLDAFARVHATHPAAVLALAGRRGRASAAIDARLAGSAIEGAVRLLGQRDDVPELLAASDCFVFPSHFEGLGGSVIEAMALELPVVASDVPALRETVEHERTGLLVPPGDPAALAAAVARVLDEPEAARIWGRNGRARFLERYTLERSGSRMVDLYRSTAAAAAAARQ